MISRNFAVIAERQALKKCPSVLVSGGLVFQLSGGNVLHPQIAADDLHAVLGQGSGLIGADDIDGTQRLHRRQAAHDGVHLHHAGDAQSQDDGHHGGQSLGHSGHSQGNGGDEHFRQVTPLADREDEQGCAQKDGQDA